MSHRHRGKYAARASNEEGRSATPASRESHQQTGGIFGSHQNIFTPAAAASSDSRGQTISSPATNSAHLEELHSQLAALQEAVRTLTSDKQSNPSHSFIPPSPTSFRSFISTSSPPIAEESSGLDFQPAPRHSTTLRGVAPRGTHFSAGDLRELLNPRKPVEEPRLSSISVASAVEFLTKWHEHGASVLGTTVPTHLSLLISPSALQTIADKNDVPPDAVTSSDNATIAKLIAKAVSFGKGPADAMLAISSHCSLRRLNSSAFSSFNIRFEILCFLFEPTSIPAKLLAKAFCAAIHNSRASGHLTSLHRQDWQPLASILKQAILLRESLDPFFGPHRELETTTRADGLLRHSPQSPSAPGTASTPPRQLVHPARQPVNPVDGQSQTQPPPRPQSQPHSPVSHRPPFQPTPGGSTRFQPRSVAAHSAQTLEHGESTADDGADEVAENEAAEAFDE